MKIRTVVVAAVGGAAILGLLGSGIASAAAADGSAVGAGMAALARAAKADKYAFIFFYKTGGQAKGIAGSLFGRDNTKQTEAMRAVFDAAASKVADKVDPVEVNVLDPSEKAIVDKFDVSRAPMPLALVVAPNGAITGGFPTKFEEKQLLGAFASPAMTKCLKVLQDSRLVMLCVQNDATKSNEAAMKGVKDFKADPRFGQATEIVKVDPRDTAEAKLLADFKIDPRTDEAVTVLLAPPGVPVYTAKGATDKATLVAKLTAAVASCGSGCGPSGCGPKK